MNILSMRTKVILMAFLLITYVSIAMAGNKKGVIMTVDGEEIPTEEFLYLYHKNNQQQAVPQTLDEYLNLFKAYRLKVAEAKSEGIDTTAGFKKEMDSYRRSLVEPYVTDTVFFNQLVEIASEREKEMVETSHIMIIRTHNPETDKKNLAMLDSLRTELLNGADFIELAKRYSQDRFSSEKGGYLGFSPAGYYPYAFETAMYETPEGEISEIVESHVGWHIVKAGARKPSLEFNRPVKTIEEIREDVRRRSSSPFDTRYHQLRANIIDRLKEKHKDINLNGLSEDEAYEALMNEEENYQYLHNPEYRNLVDEFYNGSLLYEVSVVNVWDKASNDAEGLQDFYNANQANYKWETPHAKGILIQAKNDSVAALIKERITAVASDSIVPFIRKNFKREALAERFNYSQGINPIVDELMFGQSHPEQQTNVFPVYFIIEGKVISTPESLEDVRGSVINDYQDRLEKEWVQKLNKKHKVVLNDKELGRIRKSLNQ